MRLSRSGFALATLAVLSMVLAGPNAPDLMRDTRSEHFGTVLFAVGALTHLALSLWVVLSVALAILGCSAGLLSPRIMRRALFVSATSALALSPAHADQQVPPNDHSVVGLRLPDRPASITFTATGTSTRPISGTVTVQPGDSLWAIAARFEPDGANDADIARACASWYEANRHVIGDDPNLIVPHQKLTPPAESDAP